MEEMCPCQSVNDGGPEELLAKPLTHLSPVDDRQQPCDAKTHLSPVLAIGKALNGHSVYRVFQKRGPDLKSLYMNSTIVLILSVQQVEETESIYEKVTS